MTEEDNVMTKEPKDEICLTEKEYKAALDYSLFKLLNEIRYMFNMYASSISSYSFKSLYDSFEKGKHIHAINDISTKSRNLDTDFGLYVSKIGSEQIDILENMLHIDSLSWMTKVDKILKFKNWVLYVEEEYAKIDWKKIHKKQLNTWNWRSVEWKKRIMIDKIFSFRNFYMKSEVHK